MPRDPSGYNLVTISEWRQRRKQEHQEHDVSDEVVFDRASFEAWDKDTMIVGMRLGIMKTSERFRKAMRKLSKMLVGKTQPEIKSMLDSAMMHLEEAFLDSEALETDLAREETERSS